MLWCLGWQHRAAGVWGLPWVGNRATSTPPVPARSCCPWTPAHSHSLSLHRLPSAHPLPPPADEVYAQKMKYKAISEELDNALNDITSL